MLNLVKSNLNIEINTETEDVIYNPTELIELNPKVYKTDMIMELDDVIVLAEFQSTPMRTQDNRRCRLYTALVDYARKNNKPIILLVISTPEKTKKGKIEGKEEEKLKVAKNMKLKNYPIHGIIEITQQTILNI